MQSLLTNNCLETYNAFFECIYLSTQYSNRQIELRLLKEQL